MQNKRYVIESDFEGTSPFMTYKVIETSTGNEMALNQERHSAKSLCSRLNGGGGFNGWTPDFFMHRLKIA